MTKNYEYKRGLKSEPENNNKFVSSFETPTRKEVIAKIKRHFDKHSKNILTKADVMKIADEVCKTFDYLQSIPYGKSVQDNPPKPRLVISTYPDKWSLQDGERARGCKTPSRTSYIRCSKIKITITVFVELKWISLAYVSEENLFPE